MTTSANPLLENCCKPCNSCPDDGPILETTILDPDDCNTNCCWNSCSDNRWINIQSTNDCLIVDTSECGVIKLTAECPRPTYVKAWNNVTVRDVTPPDDCYIDWGDCWVKWWWEINATDEKVKACAWDTTPGYLNQKLEEGPWINIDPIWCDWWNAKIRISLDESFIPDPPDIPDIIIDDFSSLIDATADWHRITITDNMVNTFDNVVCVWFEDTKQIPITFDSDWRATEIEWVEDHNQWWWIFTWNRAMATRQWIKILKSWHYRVFWQLTVQNNGGVANDRFFINLWRAFLKIVRDWRDIYLSTAKHWAYARQILLTWWAGISVSQDWVISCTWGSISWHWTAPEWGWRVDITGSFSPAAWWWVQTSLWFDGPWATFNIEACVDLYENDKISMWYRAQSDMAASESQPWSVWIVWSNDTTTEFDRIFWGTLLWVEQITPTLFQKWESNKLYWYI